jgi:hypothetical protein
MKMKSTGAFVDSIRKPSCSCSAVKNDGPKYLLGLEIGDEVPDEALKPESSGDHFILKV